MKKSSQNPSFGQGLELASIVIKVINNAVKENNVSSEEVQKLIGKPGKIFKMVNEIFVDYTATINEDFHLLHGNKKFVLEALPGGSRGISSLYNTFSYIDPSFKRLKLDDCIQPGTSQTRVSMYEMKKDSTLDETFNSLSNNLDELCLTQSQIMLFCKEYLSYLRYKREAFFLFKENGQYFIAETRFQGIKLDVFLIKFDSVVYSYSGRCIIVPKIKNKLKLN